MSIFPKILWTFFLLASAAAQQNGPAAETVDEIKDTLRFVRLAESKKALSFSEDKLLAVNEIADRFEETRFDLRAKERRLRFRLRRTQDSGGDGTAIIDEILALQTEEKAAERTMWEAVKKALTPTEAVAFYVFYERFQRDVQRRIRQLQGQRRNR